METLAKQTAAEVTACLKAVSDPTRLMMMKLMETNEYCVCQFVEMFGMSQPAISQHLRKLKQVGLVKESRRGQWRFSSMNHESVHASLLLSIVSHIGDTDVRLQDLRAKEKPVDCC
ncbi:MULTISPECIES: metalloregulator ArsR/SmtB family transcription factor [Planococcus]|uniref:ArsR family transcriptional regulator n=2 Tax=Planococcus TaxID=1372 RepID=A0ABM5WWK0_9BACL|nr:MULTISPECIES: metalloregulator ArsR/SmtB family transcription factor [Planococcus]ALS78719.1 ArsR family transcriptional regulator [Planococcus kocurii]AQU79319.1 transcriptional regulator [Planococcus faecalis]KAA0955162.1 winged helix-turn-helix transcriptional regulator [Planococcus sp. ANT_H30]MDJ0333489.1 metalloregulator ArsR/SmtB family transcription factor [Planococcus sp. S3-L1]